MYYVCHRLQYTEVICVLYTYLYMCTYTYSILSTYNEELQYSVKK